MSTWLISSTCGSRTVPVRNRSTQINSRSLVSLDTTHEVDFTLSSPISAPISRCLCRTHRSGTDLGKSMFAPQECPAQRSLEIAILASIRYSMSTCCPFPEMDTVLGTLDLRERELLDVPESLLSAPNVIHQRHSKQRGLGKQAFQRDCLSSSQAVTKVTQAPPGFQRRPPPFQTK